MGYKLLGFAVWKGGRWYLRRRVGVVASRKGMAAGIVGMAIVALVLKARAGDSSA
jgi:hypothetical protein